MRITSRMNDEFSERAVNEIREAVRMLSYDELVQLAMNAYMSRAICDTDNKTELDRNTALECSASALRSSIIDYDRDYSANDNDNEN